MWFLPKRKEALIVSLDLDFEEAAAALGGMRVDDAAGQIAL